MAVAVALAESGGDPHAISPSSDYGLWQINTVNFGHLGLNRTTALDPDRSARAAITMSGNGVNWAPWCTCWANPGRDCGHGYLPVPQQGTPAGSHVIHVAAVLGITGALVDAPAAESAPGVATISSAWSGLQSFVGLYARDTYGTVHNARAAIKGA